MTTLLRRHGATLVERNGARVAAHFGSPASEAAVCRSRVGLAERSDRATLELTGEPAGVEEALAELRHLGGAAWWVRPTPRRALVRCEGAAADACASVMLRAEDVAVADVRGEYAALDLVGPRAQEVLDAHLAQQETPVVVVVSRDEACVELLAPHAHGPALFHELLEVGDPFGIACVGLEALEHLDVSERLTRRRPDRAAPGSATP